MLGILIYLLLLLFPTHVFAKYDPLSVPNNRYGIHIVDTNDVPALAPLVNSTGGDWGYVTLVLSDGERNKEHWQRVFDQMRKYHLIPIVRIATHIESNAWAKPNKDKFYEIVDLLNELNWPTENQYVILFNEPNHANEWGGTLAPEEYAEDLVTCAAALKKANDNFFILPAGLDASAVDDGVAMDEAEYLRRMIAAKPEIFTLIDGWTSHSYPNPAFSGSPNAIGRGTLRTYTWELDYLKTLGLTKNLPVFITETGWQHAEGKNYLGSLLTADQVAANMQSAAGGAWSDPRITAITPFLFNYQDTPFDHFSWQKLASLDFYSLYPSYQSIPKTKGQPRQRETYDVSENFIPQKLVAGSEYSLATTIKNTGQAIMSPAEGYGLLVQSDESVVPARILPLPVLAPGETGTITFTFKTPEYVGSYPVSVSLIHNDYHILLQKKIIELVPPPSVTIRATLGWRATSESADVTILVYEDKTLMQKITGLVMKNGTVTASGLTNIVPGNVYRVVTLVPGYLPRQTIGILTAGETTVTPNRFLPLDFNGDGAFTASDIKVLLQYAPWNALTRFFSI